jgi:hypothetical protein
LLGKPCGAIVIRMFVVNETDAAAIRATFEKEGELSAAIELRRRFPGITDNTRARECARSIAGWTPLPTLPAKVVRSVAAWEREIPPPRGDGSFGPSIPPQAWASRCTRHARV